MGNLAHTHTHTHTHTIVRWPFVRDYLGEPVPEETFTHSHPSGIRRGIHTNSKDRCVGAHPLYGALSQQGLLDPVKPASNQSWSDGQLKLTASAFNRLWISMPAVLLTVPYCCAQLAASFINFLHYCSPSSGFYGAGKDRGRHTDNPSGCHPIRTIVAPISIIPPFYAECLFCCNPPNLSWLAAASYNASLHTWWQESSSSL